MRGNVPGASSAQRPLILGGTLFLASCVLFTHVFLPHFSKDSSEQQAARRSAAAGADSAQRKAGSTWSAMAKARDAGDRA
jgi:hypothetical protein